MNRLFLLVTILITMSTYSQNILAKRGTITLADNQVLVFDNIYLQDGKFTFFDVKHGHETSVPLNEVQYVEDNINSRIFTNKSVVDRVKELNQKLEEEKKKENLAKEAEYKRKLEEEKKALALGIYPPGVYVTKEDFLNKTPSNTEELVPKGLIGLEKEIIYGIPDDCFFYYLQSNKKLKHCFAVSYRGHLYFQINAILDNRNKTDRAQTNDFPNSFVRVINAGQNYYYTEADLTNAWVQAIATNTGATGVFIAADFSAASINIGSKQMFGYKKGVVWDVKNKEFNIFKNCKDFNEFIKDKFPPAIQACKEQQADINLIRKAIEMIK